MFRRIANPAERKGSLTEHKRGVRQNIKGESDRTQKGSQTEHKRSPAEHKGFLWGTEGICVGGLKEVRKAGKFKERTAE